MGKKFPADVGNQQKRRAKNQNGGENGGFGMVQAPFEAASVAVANPVEDAIFFFFYAGAEPVVSKNRNESQCDDQRADQRERHGVGHGMKELSSGTAERVDRQISGDDDGDGIEDGAVNVARGVEQDFGEVVVLSVAFAEFAIDVLHHNDGAVNDDSEID